MFSFLLTHQMYEGGAGGVQGEAEDLVPMIMWVLSQAGVVSAEIEANYMWGLLLPSASDGEASYYLEAFHSAIHALKNLTPSPDSSPGNSLDSVRQVCGFLSDCSVLCEFLGTLESQNVFSGLIRIIEHNTIKV